MRFLLTLLLLSCPLLAQDKEEEKKSELREWIKQIEDGNQKQRDEALRKLTQWATQQGAPQLGYREVGSMIVLEYEDGKNRETIRGSWTDADNKGTYTLKAKGQGTYELDASIMAPDGKLLQHFKDKGTLAELRKKFNFLKSSVAFGFARLEPGRTFVFGTKAQQTTVAPLGIRVKRPSPDLAYHLYLAPDVGFVVEHVVKGSRAEQSGLKAHDVIWKLNGRFVEDLKQLKNLKGELEIIRRAQKQTLKIGARR